MDVTVTDELASLIVRGSKAKTNDDVVQAALQLSKQMFARDSLLSRCLLEIGAELVFENACRFSSPFRFSPLNCQAVTDDLRLAIAGRAAPAGVFAPFSIAHVGLKQALSL
jgi:hypothetical protein